MDEGVDGFDVSLELMRSAVPAASVCISNESACHEFSSAAARDSE